MKVKKLIKLLQKEDPDAIVVLASDSEGNSYDTVSSVDGNAMFDPDEREITGFSELTEELRENGYSEEDVGVGEKAVVLYP